MVKEEACLEVKPRAHVSIHPNTLPQVKIYRLYSQVFALQDFLYTHFSVIIEREVIKESENRPNV